MGIAENTVKNKVEKIKKAELSMEIKEHIDHLTIYITIDQAIEPQMRPRVGKFFNIYDPLEKYKKILGEKIKTSLNHLQVNIEMNEDKYIETEIVLTNIPPKNFTKKQLIAAFLGNLKFNKKPDIDNCVKTIYDSTEGIIFFNDSQIVKETFEKKYSTKEETFIIFNIYDQPKIKGRLSKKELDDIKDYTDILNYLNNLEG